MAMTPYRQSLTHSCLAACLLMLLKAQKGIDFDEGIEEELSLKGSRRIHPFYVVGIPAECAKKFNVRIRIIADNAYFAGVLKKAFRGRKSIVIEHRKITPAYTRASLKNQPVICHIDDHILGDYSHASHFVVLEKALPNKRVSLIDPWTGKRKRLSFSKLEESVHSLKTHIKMCPLLFSIE